MNRLDAIERLKDELRATDYIAIKYVEGLDCSQYGDWKGKRMLIREKINELSGMTDEEYEVENG